MDLLDELKKYLEDIESEQDDCVTQMELAKNDFQPLQASKVGAGRHLGEGGTETMSVIERLENYIKFLEREESKSLEKAAKQDDDKYMQGINTGWADAFAFVKVKLQKIIKEEGEIGGSNGADPGATKAAE